MNNIQTAILTNILDNIARHIAKDHRNKYIFFDFSKNLIKK